MLCKCMLVNHHYFLFCVQKKPHLPFICSLDKQTKTQYGANTLRREIIRQKRGREEGGQTGSSNPGLTWLHIAFQTQSKSCLVRRLCVECVCRVRTHPALCPLWVMQSKNSRVTQTWVQIPAPPLTSDSAFCNLLIFNFFEL